MTQIDFVSYMRSLASMSTLINHNEQNKRFYRVSGMHSLGELLVNLRNAEVPAIGADDGFEGRLMDNRGDSITDRQYYAFYVFGREHLYDHDQNETEKRTIKQIALSFVKKILADRSSDFNMETSHGLRHLDVNSISYRTLAPLPDGIIAMAVSFVIDNSLNTKQDPSHWNFE